MKRTRTGIYYGWIIVLAGLLITASGVGIAANCFSLFIRPVSEDLGFSRQAMSANQTIMAMVSMVIVLFTGAIYKRFKLMRLMKLGVILLVLSYFAFSFARHIAVFYLISALVAIGQAFTTWIPLSIIIGNWFHERRGMAIGLSFMGSGLGGMLFNVLAGQWLELFGWRTTFQILAGILAAIMIPCIFLLLRAHPYDMGLEPYGSKAVGESGRKEMLHGPYLHEIVRTPRFIVLCIAMAVLGVPLNTGQTTLVPHLADIGHSAATAANVLALLMGVLAISKACLGLVFDKLGVRVGSFLSFSAIVVGLVGLSLAEYPPMIAVAVLGIGFGCAFGSVALPVISYMAYGNRSFGAVNGILTAVCSFGNALAPSLCGRMYDVTGSYQIAYIAFSGVAVVLTGVLIAALPRKASQGIDEGVEVHA